MLYILIGLAVASEIKVLGWSADERYVAIRTIENLATDTVRTGEDCGFAIEDEYESDHHLPEYPSNAVMRCTERVTFCPEYVSPESNTPFSGDLKITIFEVKKQQVNLRTFLKLVPATPPSIIFKSGTFLSLDEVEDGSTTEVIGECTSHAIAAKQLKKAKSEFKKYQIDRQSTGGSVIFEEVLHTHKSYNSSSNITIGYSFEYSKPTSLTKRINHDSKSQTTTSKTQLTYLISMQRNIIDGMDVMIVGWNKLYEGDVPETLELFTDLNLLNAAPFQSVFTAAWAGSSKYKLHSVLHSPSGNLLLFAQENIVSTFYGNYNTVELTFPIVIKTEELSYQPH
jgi:hypothetical protein